MKMLAFFMLLVAASMFWLPHPDSPEYEDANNEAIAINYAIFRNAVHDYAYKTKTPGVILPDDPGLTTIPPGWTELRDWVGLVEDDGSGELFCYVYGPAQPGEILFVMKLYNYSRAVGWNNAGIFERNGDPLALPDFIPNGNVVSVVRLD
jgi:hypothetical protein